MAISHEKLRNLKDLAKKAPQAPWKIFLPCWSSSYCGISDSRGGPICQIKQKPDNFGKQTNRERQLNIVNYLGSLSPDVILELIAEIERLQSPDRE